VNTKSPAVLEYYGFDDTKSYHPMDRKMGVISFRVGMGEKQALIYKDKKISFGNIGQKGDQIQLRASPATLGSRFFSAFFNDISMKTN
jgi:hypothetical protein